MKLTTSVSAALVILVAGCLSPKSEVKLDAADAKVPLKVLMIGNSFSASVLHVTPKVAEACGLKIDFVNCNIGGCTLKAHWANVEKSSDPEYRPYLAMFGTPESDTAKAVRAVCVGGKTNIPQMLDAVKWDVVTIQQGSVGSAFAETYQPYADNLIATIRRHAPQAEILIQETWAYLPYHPKLEEWKMTQREMYERLHENYGTLAKRTGFDPDKVRLMIDSTHLNPEGDYLQACVWLSVLCGIDARKITYAPDGIPADRAAMMRECSYEAVCSPRL